MRLLRGFASVLLAATLILVGTFGVCSTEAQAEGAVTITSVNIVGNAVAVNLTGGFPSEDGLYHLIASSANENAPKGMDVAEQGAYTTSFSVPLNKGGTNSLLYKKFTICVMAGGVLAPVSNSMFITNPEACAPVAPARMDYGKKGILPEIDPTIANKNMIADLGVTQVNINLPISKISKLGAYDQLIQKYNSMGMQVTMIILADKAAGKDYISPYSYNGMGKAHDYYAFNASSEEALNRLGDAMAYVAQHYSNIGYGQVDNYIIGNEVNAWYKWNYMKANSNDAIMAEYYKAFRVMYNGIKSANGSAAVYTCIDHEWAYPEASYYISGKEFLVKFNTLVSSEGNIDWKLATHPNNAQLLNPRVWEASKYITHDQSTGYISMVNLEVLTDFMCLPEMLSPSGEVRTIKLAEVGYPSNKGQEIQAASVAFAYYAAMNNQYVDGILILREADNSVEIAQGLACGLCDKKGNPKMAYNFYKYADDPSIMAQANAIAGVDLTTLISPR